MPNYNESMIYKLCCKDTTIEEIYIGSTISFRHRKSCHNQNCNKINGNGYNRKVYQFIRNNGGWDNWDMILIAKVNCNDRLELRKKEREYMEEYKPSLNIIKAQREEEEKKEYCKEYDKKYRETNKEEILEKQKKYRETNKEDISERQKRRYKTNKEDINEKKKVKVSCECGSTVRKADITKHYKSKKHINFINTI